MDYITIDGKRYPVSDFRLVTKPRTNADRIRAMTDEELARWFTDKEIKAYERCGYKGNKDRFEKQWLAWLKQEANT